MWNITKMSKISKIPTDTLRYYDKLKIVSPKRAGNGYRYYDEKDYILLQYVSVMKYAHFSLSDIKKVIQSFKLEVSENCNKVNYGIFTSKRTELIEMIKNYQGIVKLIDNLLPMVEGSKNYYENEQKIAALVQEIYQSIS